MMTRRDFIETTLASVSAGAFPVALSPGTTATALDRYVAQPTPEYRFEVVDTLQGVGYRTRVVSLVSQSWRSAREVDRPVWKHWLTITEPEKIATRVAVLVISGGSNNDAQPKGVSPFISAFALRTGAVVAELRAVPSQPLTFADESTPRSEDDLVAYSYDKYLRSGDETWLIRLPMTKAVVRAMDAILAYFASSGQPNAVDRFVVGGASKRGWTAWLTPVLDSRVIAIVPVVIDVLNISAQAEHAYRVYGSWPSALEPYRKMGVMRWLGTPQFASLAAIEDPYSYRARITVPKFIVNAAGDQFFTPDSSHFYYDALRGEKYLRYVPNTDHSLNGAAPDAARSGLAFFDSIIRDAKRPRFTWEWLPSSVRVHSNDDTLSVKLWHAVNGHARDFRLQTIGRAFTATTLHDIGDRTYEAEIETPQKGFAASFVEITYRAPSSPGTFTVTTDVRITPDVLPYGPP